MNNNQVLSPIAIDLGAKNTGVYFAHYPDLDNLNKEDLKKFSSIRTFIMDKKTFSLLMKDRTARRHQKRANIRSKLAKRFFILIARQEYPELFEDDNKINENIKIAISYFLNRRGFSFASALEKLDDEDNKLLGKLPSHFVEKMLSALEKNEYSNGKEIARLIRAIVSDLNEKDLNLLEFVKYRTNSPNEYSELQKLLRVPIDEFKKELRKEIAGLDKINEDKKRKKLIADKKKKITEEFTTRFGILRFNDSEPKLPNDENGDPDYSISEESIPDDINNTNERLNHYYKWVLYYLFEIINETGNYHRKDYFENCRKDYESANNDTSIGKCIRQLREKIGDNRKIEFQNLLFNISNFQLRLFRKFFNNKEHQTGDKWEPERLDKIFIRYIRSWHVDAQKDGADKLKIRKDILSNFHSLILTHGSRTITFLKNTTPTDTIPPYEDQNNRNIPNCQSLLINLDYFSNKKQFKYFNEWYEILTTKKFAANLDSKMDLSLSVEINNTLSSYDNYLKRTQSKTHSINTYLNKIIKDTKSRKLAFVLDSIRTLHKGKKKDAVEYLLSHIEQNSNNNEIKIGFSDFIYQYYWAIDNSKNTKVNQLKYTVNKNENPDPNIQKNFPKYIKNYFKQNSILLECEGKTPSKNNTFIESICNILLILKSDIKEDLINDKNKINELQNKLIDGLKSKKISRSSVYSHLEKCAKAQKDYKNILNEKLKEIKNKEDTIDKEDKPLKNISDNIEIATDEIINVANTTFQINKHLIDRTKINNIYTHAQLFSFLDDRKGYSTICRYCVEDNLIRLTKINNTEKRITHRLSASSVRIIDGVVEKYLGHLARIIANSKWQQIKSYNLEKGATVNIPVFIEENKFDFEVNLSIYKGKNSKKVKKSKIYSLEDRIKDTNIDICPYTGKKINNMGELDHILPRSYTTKYFKQVFNSDANLIYVSQEGNRDKEDRLYKLSNLNTNYLKVVFPDCKDTDEISNKIIANIPKILKDYSNFANLNSTDQHILRHSLFLPENHPMRKRVIEEVLMTHNKTKVNGTQGYFCKLLRDELIQRNNGEFNLDFYFQRIPALEVSYYRKTLSKEEQKQEKQPPYSHCIDAMLIFTTGMLNIFDSYSDSNKIENLVPIQQSWKLANVLLSLLTSKSNKNIQDTKQLLHSIYSLIKVNESDHSVIPIERSTRDTINVSHRKLYEDNFYALRIYPLWLGCKKQKKESEIILSYGFNEKTISDLSVKNKKLILKYLYLLSEDSVTKLRNCGISDELMSKKLSDIELIAVENKLQNYFSTSNQKLFWLNIDRAKFLEFYKDNNIYLNKESDKDEDVVYYKVVSNELTYKTTRESLYNIFYDEKGNFNKKKLSKEHIKESTNDPNVEKILLKIYDNLIKSANPDLFADDLKGKNRDIEILKEIFQKPRIELNHRSYKQKLSIPINSKDGAYITYRKGWDNSKVIQISKKSNNVPQKKYYIDTSKLKEQTNDIYNTKNNKSIDVNDIISKHAIEIKKGTEINIKKLLIDFSKYSNFLKTLDNIIIIQITNRLDLELLFKQNVKIDDILKKSIHTLFDIRNIAEEIKKNDDKDVEDRVSEKTIVDKHLLFYSNVNSNSVIMTVKGCRKFMGKSFKKLLPNYILNNN
ncbi:MAG: HNH endonuclease domain-containing protein [Methylacidiphilales bacterium]|nr:HNH endonuclease domain-containing protein [Candidatus Methylacidiphilales bacterium]